MTDDQTIDGEVIESSTTPVVAPDADNRLLADHLLHTLMEFGYEGYGVDDFPVVDPEAGGPSEMLLDLALVLAKNIGGYFKARAEVFQRAGDPTSQTISRVLFNVASEIGDVYRHEHRQSGEHSHGDGHDHPH